MKSEEFKLPAFDKSLDSFLDNSAVIAWMKDAQGRHVYLSQNFLKRFSIPDKDWMGKTDFELWPREIAEAFRVNDLVVLENGKTIEVEERAVNPDGTTSWWLNHKFLFEDQDGNRYVGGLGVDITSRKQAEDSKSKFLARMSHEFRTPLNAILGFSQVLELDKNEPLLPRQRESVKQILHSGEHMLEIVDDLLDLATIEAGKVEMCFQAVDLIEMIQHCLDTIAAMASQRNIGLNNQVLDSCTNRFVRADVTRLRQVLLNLLSNAVKYNRVGGSITVACEPTGSEKTRITVTDTGSGIPDEDIATLFEPFSRLYLKTYAQQGTGIGLNISKQLIQYMNGQIGVSSVPGEGSTFWIELPVSPPPELKPLASRAEDEPVSIADNESLLLYIEDSPSHTKLLESIVDSIPDTRLLTAHTPNLGLELAYAHVPDIIVCDICLPGMDGFEVLQQLRARENTRDIPVIALSANAAPAEIEKGLRAGFRRYLTKPLKVAEFIRAVGELQNDLRAQEKPKRTE